MAAKHVLVIENEGKMARFLAQGLRQAGYCVHLEGDGLRGLACACREKPDMILLDRILPGMDGAGVFRKIREFSPVPILLLTAKGAAGSGAAAPSGDLDDSIQRPFGIGELLAKTDALFRREELRKLARQTLALKDLSLDTIRHTVRRGGTNIVLTKREFDLLEYLLKNQGLVLTRAQVLKNVWKEEDRKNINIVDVYIHYLRSKIDGPFRIGLIHTVRGAGYVLEDNDDFSGRNGDGNPPDACGCVSVPDTARPGKNADGIETGIPAGTAQKP